LDLPKLSELVFREGDVDVALLWQKVSRGEVNGVVGGHSELVRVGQE